MGEHDKALGDLMSISPLTPTATQEEQQGEAQSSALDELMGNLPRPDPVLNLEVSRDTNPDEFIQNKETADAVGLPVEAVEEAPEEPRRVQREEALDSLLIDAPATSRFLERLENAKAASDSVNNLGTIERLSRGFQRGQSLSQLGYAGIALRGDPTSEEKQQYVARLQKRLQDLGQDTEGFVSAMSGVMEFFGQRVAAISRPRASTMTAAGAGIGAAAGLGGGPLAPVTVPAAATAGAISGFISHNIMDVGEVEAGLSYVEQLEEGVDPDVAYWTSLGVGVINAGLETAGGASFLKPLSDMGKKAFKEGLRNVVKNPAFIEAARKAATAYGINLGVETGTEVAQEVVNIAAEELGKHLTDGLAAEWTPEEWEERLSAIAIKTLKTTALLGAPGPSIGFVYDVRKARKADANASAMDTLREALLSSPLTERSPNQAAEHLAETFADEGIYEVYIPVEALEEAAIASGDPEAFYENLGVTDQLEDARTFNGDIRIKTQNFSEHILQTDAYDSVRDNIRMDEDSLTVAEGQEAEDFADDDMQAYDEAMNITDEEDVAFAAIKLPDGEVFTGAHHGEAWDAAIAAGYDETEVISKSETGFTTSKGGFVTREEALDIAKARGRVDEGRVIEEGLDSAILIPSPEVEASTTLAEHEMGVQTLFKTAAEAGFTEAQYASYIEAIRRARDVARRRKERTRLKRLAKRVEKRYQEKRARIEEEEREHASQEPSFQALLAIGRDRLDYNEVLEILGGDEAAMKRLPKVNGQRIYAPKGEQGISPWVHADIFGLEGGDIMLFEWIDKPGFEETVQQRTDERMEIDHPTVATARQEINEALEALHTDNYANVLAFELNKMREARGQKRLKLSLVKAKARKIMENFKLSDIKVRQLEALQKREARRARKAVREGDLDTAAKAKLNQLVAFQMTKEAYKVQEEVKRGNKYMKKFLSNKKLKTLPVDFKSAIKNILSRFQLGPRLSDSKREALETWMKEKANEGVAVVVPQAILDADNKINYQDLSLAEWRELRNTVKALHKDGVEMNKLRRDAEDSNVQVIVDEIVVGVQDNLKQRTPKQAEAAAAAGDKVVDISALETMFARVKEAKEKFGINVSTILLNTDSILRSIDGFKSLGVAYRYIKGGIDLAITEGYLPGQVGYVARMKQESEKLVKLMDMFSKTELARMGREQDIPGVRARLTRREQIGVLLNLGNASNIQALLDSGEFTEMELQAILDNASKRDLDFVQGVWDFLESFRPEIIATVKRRQNRIPNMIDAVALETQHGEYRGGYFPLQYDSEKKVLEGDINTQEAIDMMLSGGFTAGHTQDGHTQTRKGSGGRPVKLDPFVLNNHVQQLIYDLEVGDAVHDAYKVLHHKDTKKAFGEAGQTKMWDAIDLWFGDAVTGEIHHNNQVERALRHIRTGTTISALAINFSVAALQPLGLLQSAVQIGKKNVMLGLYDLLSSGNPYQMYQWVTSQSGFMKERERSFNKDVHDAQKGLNTGWLSKYTPGRTAEHISDTMFWPIAKMQRFVDIVTWLGAKRQGLEMFEGDDAKSTRHADRMVARTQGSGNFQERTAFERGTVSKAVRNSEMVRIWSLFLNYFAAKLNVSYERTKTTNFRNAFEVVDYASDMALLFAIEGFLASVVKEGWPDPEEDEDAFGKRMAKETVKTAVAGVPMIREAVSAAEGFDTGGAFGSFAGKLGRAYEQVAQGEMDIALLKSINSILGILFKYPTSQVHKTGQAIYDASEEEEVDKLEYIMGPRFNK